MFRHLAAERAGAGICHPEGYVWVEGPDVLNPPGHAVPANSWLSLGDADCAHHRCQVSSGTAQKAGPYLPHHVPLAVTYCHDIRQEL